jgi:hypothetical protein
MVKNQSKRTSSSRLGRKVKPTTAQNLIQKLNSKLKLEQLEVRIVPSITPPTTLSPHQVMPMGPMDVAEWASLKGPRAVPTTLQLLPSSTNSGLQPLTSSPAANDGNGGDQLTFGGHTGVATNGSVTKAGITGPIDVLGPPQDKPIAGLKGLHGSSALLGPHPGGVINLGTSFEGLNFSDTSCGCLPPDNALAVGNGSLTGGVTYVMEGVNTAIRITDTTGHIYSTEEESTFFSSLGQGAFGDPQIVYDDIGNHWIVENFTGNFGGLEFAVSKDANPLDGFYNFQALTLGFPDYAKIGYNADNIYINYDNFSSYNVQSLVIDRQSFENNTGFNHQIYTLPGGFFSTFDVFPARMHGAVSGDPEYLVGTNWSSFNSGGTQLNIWQATGGAYNAQVFTPAPVGVNPYGGAVAASQPGSPFSVDTDSSFMGSADWRNGELVSAHHGTLPGDPSTTVGLVDEFNAPAGGGVVTLNQEIDINDPTQGQGLGTNSYYVAAALDTSGDIGMTWMESSSSEFVSMYVGVHGAGDAPGTYTSQLVRSDGAFMVDSFRAGDYSTATVDPTNGNEFWMSNEYSPAVLGSGVWATYTASFNSGLAVTSTNPSANSVIMIQPADFTVNWSAPVDPLTVSTSDFSVNGINPSFFALSNGNKTIDFYYTSSPVTVEGPQSMAIPGGVISNANDTQTNSAFSANFRWDPHPMFVSATNPNQGAIAFVSGNTENLDLFFSEQFDATTINTGNITVSQGNVTAATVLSNTGGVYEVDYTISNINQSEKVNYSMAAGAINDADGNPVLAYASNFLAYVPVLAYPTPLDSKPPTGSLIYDPSVSGTILAVGLTESYTISLNAGQTLTWDLTTDSILRGQVQIYDPSMTLIGSGTAAAAGDEIVVGPAGVNTAGTYTIVISSLGNTTGNYTGTLILNAALDSQDHGGANNSSRGSAQDLTSSFINIGYGATRGAVLGQLTGPSAGFGDALTINGNAPGNFDVLLIDQTGKVVKTFTSPAFAGLYLFDVKIATDNTFWVLGDLNFFTAELIHMDLNGDTLGTITSPVSDSGGFLSPEGFGMNPADGSFWIPLLNSGNILHLSSTGAFINEYFVGGTPDDVAFRPADGNVYISQIFSGFVEELNPTTLGTSIFAFAPEPVDLTWSTADELWVGALFGGAQRFSNTGTLLQVYDGSGAIAAEPLPGTNVWDTNIFTARVNQFAPGGSSISSTPFTSFQPGIAVFGDVPGEAAFPPGQTTFYSFTLGAGDSVSIVGKGLAGETMELLDSGGNELAVGAGGFAKVDQYIKDFVNTTGSTQTYYVELLGTAPGTQHYSLVITENADFGVGGDNNLGSAQSLGTNHTVLGALGKAGALFTNQWESSLPLPGHQIDPTTGAIQTTFNITAGVVTNPFGENMAFDGTDLYYNDGPFFGDNRVFKLDPTTGNVISSFLPNEPFYLFDIAWYNGHLWGTDDTNLYEFDASGNVIQQFNSLFDGATTGLAGDPDHGVIWAVSQFHTIFEVNPTTGQVIQTKNDGLAEYEQDMAYANGNLYISEATSFGTTDIAVFDSNTLTLKTKFQVNTIPTFWAGMGGDGLGGIDKNYYSFNVNAGDNLEVQASAFNGGGSGQFQNNLDLVINLYDNTGALVATGNAGSPIFWTALTSGTYYAEIEPASGTTGEYVLNVTGNTGGNTPFNVTATDPVNGTYLNSLSSVTTTFNKSVLLTSLNPDDFIIQTDSVGDTEFASSFTVVNDHTITWNFATIPTDTEIDVTHLWAVDGVTDLQGDSLQGGFYEGNVIIVNVAPSIVSTSVNNGDILQPGTLNFVVTFNQTMNTSFTTDASFDLFGIYHNVHYTPSSITWGSDGNFPNDQVTITYDPPDDAYTMTLFQTGFENPVGQDLTAGDTVNFSIDATPPTPFPIPLKPVLPLGSLVYTGAVTDVIANSTDTDFYQININSDQQITVDLTTASTLAADLFLEDQNGNILASASASAGGQELYFNSVPTNDGLGNTSTYTIVIDGYGTGFESEGLYNLTVTLNAALDNQTHGGASNNTIGTAQALSFLNVSSQVGVTSSISQAAVLGTFTVAGAAFGDSLTIDGGFNGKVLLIDQSGTVVNTFSSPAFAGLYLFDVKIAADNTFWVLGDLNFFTAELIHMDLSGNTLGTIVSPISDSSGFLSPEGFSYNPADGSFWIPLLNSGNVLHLSSSGAFINEYFVGGTPNDVAFNPTDGNVYITQVFSDYIQELNPTTSATSVFISFVSFPLDLAWSTADELWVGALFGGAERFSNTGALLQTYDGSGVVAAEPYPGTNVWDTNIFTARVNQFTPGGSTISSTPFSPFQPGVAVFGDVPGEASFGAAQGKFYSVFLNQGETITAVIKGLTNNSASIEIDDGSGNTLAIGIAGGTGVDQSIENFVARSTGTYYIKVTASKTVNYDLVVTRDADFDMQSGNSSNAPPSSFQDITATVLNPYGATGGGGAIGTLEAAAINVGNSFEGVDFSTSNCGCLPPDTNAAEGNGFVVETVNEQIRMFNTSGAVLFDESMNTFFGASTGGDVYVVYDNIANRWYVESLDSTDGGFDLAISNDGNPLDGFTNKYDITAGTGGPITDYPKMGFNFDAIFISYNNFGSGGGNATVVSIEKAPALTGTLTYFVNASPSFQFRAMPPVQYHDDTTGGTEWFFSTDGNSTSGSTMRVTQMTNYFSNSPTWNLYHLPVAPYHSASRADQPGGSVTTFPNTTTYEVQERQVGGHTYLITGMSTAFGDAYPKGAYYVADITNPGAPFMAKSGEVDPGAGVAAQMFSADMDANGNLGFSWIESSSTENLSMWVGTLDTSGNLSSSDAAPGGGFMPENFRIGDYSTTVYDPSTNLFWSANEYIGSDGGSDIWRTHITSFAAAAPVDNDWYSVNTNAGDNITAIVNAFDRSENGIYTGEFENAADPTINVYDQFGNLVASGDASDEPFPGGAESVNFTSTGGVYYIEVSTEEGGNGEYVLSVQGATGSLPPFTVTSTNPANGDEVKPPASITVTFSAPIFIPSIGDSNLTIDGMTSGTENATGFMIDSANTVTYFLPQDFPAGDEVVHNINVSGVEDVSAGALTPYSLQITVDNLVPTVTATNPANGGVVITPNPANPLQFIVTFSEQMNPAATTAASFELFGNFRGVSYSVASISWGSDGAEPNDQVTVTYNNLPDDSYTMTLFSGGFQDEVGYFLNGIGDGTGANYSSNFEYDIDATFAYPTPLGPKAPAGGLIYDPSVTGVLVPAGDSDTYSINVNAGNTISVLMTSGALQGNIQLFDPHGNLIAVGSAAALGQDAVIQPQAVGTDSGVWTIVVSDVPGTDIGLYHVQVVLNAALDTGTYGGPENSSFATAQDISASSVTLGTNGVADRLGVLGTFDGNTDYYSFHLSSGQSVSATLNLLTSGFSGLVHITLFDPSQTPVAFGTAGPTNVNEVINNFTAGSTGTYYLWVWGSTFGPVDYSVTVERGAVFELEPNNSFVTAQNIDNVDGALGAIVLPHAVTVTNSFDGIDFNGSNCGCLPPDTNASVGNGFVAETVNIQYRVFNEAGTMLLDEPLSSVFGASTGGDPYVIYDTIANRWYITAFDSSDSGLFLAVSNSGDPTAGFGHVYDLTNVGGFPDYNKPGYNFDGIFISFNDFGSNGGFARIASIEKGPALTGSLVEFVNTPKNQFRAMPPAQYHDDTTGGTEWFFSTDGTTTSGSTMRVTQMTNYFSNSANFTYTSLPVAPYQSALRADQPGGSVTVFPNTTTYEVQERSVGGHTYLVAGMSSAFAADGFTYPKGAYYVVDITNPALPTMAKTGEVDPGAGVAAQMFSVDMDKNGDLGFTWIESSSSEFLSMWVGTIDTLGNFASADVAPGGGFFSFNFRIGDYATTVVDPSDGLTFWSANEYIGSNGGSDIWKTHIASFQAAALTESAYYAIDLTAGQTINLTTFTPSEGSGEFQNGLQPVLFLYDPMGNLVATGTPDGDGTNVTLTWTAAAGDSGTYFAQITSASSTSGEYYLEKTIVTPQSFSGLVYNDANDDHVFDAGDSVLAGVPIFIDGSAIPATFTNVSGDYTVTLTPGAHTISEGIPTGYIAIAPASGELSVTASNGGAPVSGEDFADALPTASLDDSQAGYTNVPSGQWFNMPQGWMGESQIHAATVNAKVFASWNVGSGVAIAKYEVFVTYVAAPNRAQVYYTLYDGVQDNAHEIAKVFVDQSGAIDVSDNSNGTTWDGTTWLSLGKYNITQGNLIVVMTGAAGGKKTMDADGVLYIPAGAAVAPQPLSHSGITGTTGSTSQTHVGGVVTNLVQNNTLGAFQTLVGGTTVQHGAAQTLQPAAIQQGVAQTLPPSGVQQRGVSQTLPPSSGQQQNVVNAAELISSLYVPPSTSLPASEQNILGSPKVNGVFSSLNGTAQSMLNSVGSKSGSTSSALDSFFSANHGAAQSIDLNEAIGVLALDHSGTKPLV